ncbi:MAG: AIR synthase related protein [Promethearchaeota archaeon]
MDDKKLSYDSLGVSSNKEDVHDAIKNVDKGLFPSAFCKVIPDVLTGDKEHCLILHADGAGTKSIIAYLDWKEYGDPAVFRGIAQDALVMNIDDIACTGIVSGFGVSNTIGRNKNLVSGKVIAEIIKGYEDFSKMLSKMGVEVFLCGGETADVGDIVRTVIVDSTVIVRSRRDSIIKTKNIQPGDVIVGLASFGKATYENRENSGISSNGITLARHALLSHHYVEKYPEIADPSLKEHLAYVGRFNLDDKLQGSSMTISDALLSPTRTYLPVLKSLFSTISNDYGLISEHIHGIIHDTGGGQVKCLHFGRGIKYIKNDLFPAPRIFREIQESGNVEWKEMYNVFNMGHRLEVICPESIAGEVVRSATKFNIDAKVIGFIERNDNARENELVIESEFGVFNY